MVDITRQLRTERTMVRVGDRMYPAIRSNRCSTCQHPARPEIEERMLFNEPYARIAAWVAMQVQEDGTPWPSLNANQLSRHYKLGHCPNMVEVAHDIADELGHDYETSATRIVSTVLLAKQTVARTQERLVRGEIEPSLRDGLAAATLLHQIESTGRALDQNDRLAIYEQAMGAYFAEAQRIMTAEQWQAFGQALSTSPVLREIESRIAAMNAVDADIVEITA